MREINPGNPFGGHLGRSEPIFVGDGVLLNSPIDTLVDAMVAAYQDSAPSLADTPEFRQFLEREFPVGASEFSYPVSRRKFVQIMSDSYLLGGLGVLGSGCRKPEE